jgi:hypothetical protein
LGDIGGERRNCAYSSDSANWAAGFIAGIAASVAQMGTGAAYFQALCIAIGNLEWHNAWCILIYINDN